MAAAFGAQLAITRHCTPTARSRFFAAVIAAGSAALAACAVVTLRSHGTEISPEHPERTTHLVTDGPYARTRNPIYLALVGLLAAHAVYRRSMAALAPAAGFAVAVDRAQIPREEHALQARFGKRYTKYRKTVPRWWGVPER